MIGESLNIRGVAIRPGISKNGINYIPEELEKFAMTLVGKPILKDHNSEVDNTVGLVETSSGDGTGVVNYEGWVKEDGTGLLEKINDGRAKEVSIGAFVHQLVKENDDDEHLTAIGIEGMELSITPTPAIRGTSLMQSLKSIKEFKTDKSVKIKPINENVNNFKDFVNESTEEKMAEEETKIEDAPKEEEQKAAEAPAEEPVKEEEPKTEEPAKEEAAKESKTVTVDVDSSQVVEAIKQAEKLLVLKGKLAEKKEEPVKESKLKGKIAKIEDVKTEEPKATESYVAENCDFGDGLSLWKHPKADGSYL